MSHFQSKTMETNDWKIGSPLIDLHTPQRFEIKIESLQLDCEERRK